MAILDQGQVSVTILFVAAQAHEGAPPRIEYEGTSFRLPLMSTAVAISTISVNSSIGRPAPFAKCVVVLADTSVWIDHLRRGNARLAGHLENGEVEAHPFVVGELACGNLGRRDEILSLLGSLPHVIEADHEEVLSLVNDRRLAEQARKLAVLFE